MAELYRAGEVSTRLGIPPSTLRLYSVRFARWLSPGAAAPGGAGGRRGHRSYTAEDLAILARVKELLARGRTVAEVEEALGPPPAARSVGNAAPSDVPSTRAREKDDASAVGSYPSSVAAAPHALGGPAPPMATPAPGSGPTGAPPAAPPGVTVERIEMAQQVVALALRALAEAQQSEEVWRRLLERRQREAQWLRAEALRQEVELARLVVRLNERMRLVLRRVDQLAAPVQALVEAHATAEIASQQHRR